ncbi:MAG: PspC domain-containing protein [Chitinophagaceae bacterium]
MKKIININFQGRIIPIEETAYDILKHYIESLRVYFMNEEGRDEIINDIESRIAELFSDRLKRTTSCITDEDVNSVIASIGRPEELEEAEGATSTSNFANVSGANAQHAHQSQYIPLGSRRLYRSENDKIIGGVASGLANYFGIDPAIMRLLFVLFLFMGFGVLLYIILWIVVPAKTLVTNVRKRLYRNREHRMLGGVASGLGAYLNIDVWIPRIIFLLPFILGVLGNIFRSGWFDFNPVPNFLFNGFGGTLIICYIILWIVLPEATTATEKLEMRGEKVDLESIKKTVKEDLENIKGRAEKVGGEIKERAQFYGQEIRQAGQSFAMEAGPVVRRSGSGIGHAIGVLFKAFFLFIAGIIVFALLMALMALLFNGVSAFPFKTFLLTGFWQNFLAWSTLILFLGIPILALLTWLIRRIVGVRSRNNYLGYAFGSLWILGLVSAIALSGLVARNFRSRTSVKEDIPIAQPSSNKLLLKVSEGNVNYYGSDWFGFDDNLPFFSKNEDSIMMKMVRIEMIRSRDSFYHANVIKFSNGNTPTIAENLAGRIRFPVTQSDSMVYLPIGFAITQEEKFRNQQVMLIIEVPVGKKIELHNSVNQYKSFNINMNGRRGWNIDWDDRWDNFRYYNRNEEYVMTLDGLKETDKKENTEEKGKLKIRIDEDGVEMEGYLEKEEDGRYRYYKEKIDTVKTIKRDTIKGTSMTFRDHEEATDDASEYPASNRPDPATALYTMVKLFQ